MNFSSDMPWNALANELKYARPTATCTHSHWREGHLLYHSKLRLSTSSVDFSVWIWFGWMCGQLERIRKQIPLILLQTVPNWPQLDFVELLKNAILKDSTKPCRWSMYQIHTRRFCSVNINSAIVNLTFYLKMAEENKENACATSMFPVIPLPRLGL